MNQLWVIAVIAGVALARPETYREKEDFQFSRSSSDEGTKSGFYGAQRGNMGGNYERAKNMDTVAQKQMSSAIHQVEGELGDTSNSDVGSVFTSANTHGSYSQRQYDLSNLQGRNFQDGSTVLDDSSHSALSHSGYGSHSAFNSHGFSGHNARLYSSNSDVESLHKNNLQALDQISNGYREYGRQSGYGSEYHSHSGNIASLDQQQSNLYSGRSGSQQQYATKNRLVGYNGAPIRIAIRPSSTVDVPVAAETYEDRHASSASQSTLNRDVEVLTNPNNGHVVARPSGGAKHYESSYNYHKEWEKHDSKPVTIPLSIPTSIPQNQELYDANRVTNNEFQGNAIASSGFQAAANSQSHYESQHQQQYNALHHGASYNALSNGGYSGAYKNDNDEAVVGTAHIPSGKKYESSYSYHKSWERQGDPYVIQPVSSIPVDSQRLTAATNQNAYGSHYYSSHNKQAHQSYTKSGQLVDCDCDDGTHSRVVRSVDSIHQRNHEYDPYANHYEQEALTQQVQDFGNLRYLRNRSQNKEFGQGEPDLENLGQQTQNHYDNLEQFERATQEDLGQQTQDTWGNFEHFKEGKSQKTEQDVNEHVIPVWEMPEDDSQHTLVHAVQTENGPFTKPTAGQLDIPTYFQHSPMHNHQQNNFHSYAHNTFEHSSYESHQHHDCEDPMHEHELLNNDQKPLEDLWAKIYGLQQTYSSNGHNVGSDQHVYQDGYAQHDLDFQSSLDNWHGDSVYLHNSHHNQNGFRSQFPGQVSFEESTPATTVKAKEISTTTLKPSINSNEQTPKNIGRGDIGTDDLSYDVTPPTVAKSITEVYSSPSSYHDKHFKTPAEIEALSLTKENNRTEMNTGSNTAQQATNNLGVLGLNDQKLELQNNQEQVKNITNISSGSYHEIYQDAHSQNKHEVNANTDSTHNSDDVYQGSFDQQTHTDADKLLEDMIKDAMRNYHDTELKSFDQQSGYHQEELGQEIISGHSLSTFETQSNNNDYQQSMDKANEMYHVHHNGQQTYEEQTSELGKEDFGQQTIRLPIPSEALSEFGTHSFESHKHQYHNQHTEDSQHEIHSNTGLETENLNIPVENNRPQNQEYLSPSDSESLLQTQSNNKQQENFDQQTDKLIDMHPSRESINSQILQNSNGDQQIEQNVEQHDVGLQEDFSQQSVNLQNSEIEDFKKYVYDPSKIENLEQSADDTQEPTNFDARSLLTQNSEDNFYRQHYNAPNAKQVSDEKELNSKTSGGEPQSQNADSAVVATVSEVTTEKPGFWKSVGNKFSTAKKKVSSWFSS